MKFLIPPSEGKSLNNTYKHTFKETSFEYTNYVKELLRLLKTKETDSEIISIYSASLEKSLLFHKQNLDIFNSNCSLAIERYTGVVFKHINWNTLDNKSKVFFDKHFLIFSAMLGAISPMCKIPNYKLKMNVLRLVHFWNPINTEKLKDEDVIIDLLPQIHRKAYKLDDRVISIDILDIKNGKKVNAGHLGKGVKGEFIRFICENKINKIDDFSNFNYKGFHWDGKCLIREVSNYE